MITKEILRKIISDSIDASKESLTEEYEYGPKKKALLQYLKSFSRKDQVLLFALMDYGREKYNMRSKEKDAILFKEKMNSAEKHNQDDFIAEHLIGKVKNLSHYFEYALNILEE